MVLDEFLPNETKWQLLKLSTTLVRIMASNKNTNNAVLLFR